MVFQLILKLEEIAEKLAPEDELLNYNDSF
jgi:hypothetical protein